VNEDVSAHYGGDGDLIEKITEGLCNAGKDPGNLKTIDLSAIDEFHFQGRKATLKLAGQMKLNANAQVLDIGSGLGGAARTLAEEYDCHVTGIDLTKAFCDASSVLSDWVSLGEITDFRQGDATNLPFPDNQFDAAITIHVAMNIPAKDKMYEQARRVLKQGGIFAVYDILQGEGGKVLYPAPWARDSSISHLATPDEMENLLTVAGFRILDVYDSTEESLNWLETRKTSHTDSQAPPITTQILFGGDFDWQEMIRNQACSLRERRMRTVSYICEA